MISARRVSGVTSSHATQPCAGACGLDNISIALNKSLGSLSSPFGNVSLALKHLTLGNLSSFRKLDLLRPDSNTTLGFTFELGELRLGLSAEGQTQEPDLRNETCGVGTTCSHAMPCGEAPAPAAGEVLGEVVLRDVEVNAEVWAPVYLWASGLELAQLLQPDWGCACAALMGFHLQLTAAYSAVEHVALRGLGTVQVDRALSRFARDYSRSRIVLQQRHLSQVLDLWSQQLNNQIGAYCAQHASNECRLAAPPGLPPDPARPGIIDWRHRSGFIRRADLLLNRVMGAEGPLGLTRLWSGLWEALSQHAMNSKPAKFSLLHELVQVETHLSSFEPHHRVGFFRNLQLLQPTGEPHLLAFSVELSDLQAAFTSNLTLSPGAAYGVYQGRGGKHLPNLRMQIDARNIVLRGEFRLEVEDSVDSLTVGEIAHLVERVPAAELVRLQLKGRRQQPEQVINLRD
eukprot:gene1794-2462_t